MKVNIAVSGSSILFHATNLDNAVSILESKTFLLRPSVTPDEARLGSAMYFMSTARSILSSYFNQLDVYAVFQLDGNRVGQRYKVVPYEFFDVNYTYKEDEKEDRIISREPTIPIKYVSAIHIPVGRFKDFDGQFGSTSFVLDKDSWSKVQKIKRLAKKLGLPVYFYPDDILVSIHPKKRIDIPLEQIKVNPLPLPDSHKKLSPTRSKTTKEHSASKRLTRIVTLDISKLQSERQQLQEWYVSHDRLYPYVLWLINNNRNPYSAPVLAKMRRHRWDIVQLTAYVRAKLMYIFDNTLLTDLLYDSLTRDLNVGERNILAKSNLAQVDVEKVLIREENLDYAKKLYALSRVDLPQHLSSNQYEYII